MNIIEAIKKRSSTRAFLNKPVSKEIITQILEAARWAPSGANIQPWIVAIVTGATKQKISEAIVQARKAGQMENPDYPYYPTVWVDPYKTRRKHCGTMLYSALGIAKNETEKREKAWYQNYCFFDAPVGLFFFVDEHMEKGSWVDMGMFIQNIMLAAIAFDLATCPQASMAEYPDIVRQHLGINKDKQLICGLSIGYPDKTAPVNQYKLERIPVEEFATWYD